MPYRIRGRSIGSAAHSAQDLSIRDELLRYVRTLASRLSRIPRQNEVEQKYSDSVIQRLFGRFETLLLDAKLYPQKFNSAQLLALLKDRAEKLHHPLTEADVDNDLTLPAAGVYRHYFGGVPETAAAITSESIPQNTLDTLLSGARGHRAAHARAPVTDDAPHAEWKLSKPILEKAVQEKWTPEQLEAALHAVDAPTAAILANLMHPPDHVQHPKAALARELGLSWTVYAFRERLLIATCQEMKWPIAPRSLSNQARADASVNGREHWKAIDAVIAQTKAGKWSRDRFETALRVIDPKVAAVFANLTHPPQGERQSQTAMAKSLKSSGGNVVEMWEVYLDAICTNMHWPIIELPDEIKERSRYTNEGRELWQKINGIVKQAKAQKWSPKTLDVAIYAASEKVAIILRNLNRPDLDRLRQQDLADTLGIHVSTVVAWEARLRAIYRTLGWVVPEPRAMDWREFVGPGATAYAMQLVHDAIRDLSLTNTHLKACLQGNGDPAMQRVVMERLVAIGRSGIVDTLRRSGDMSTSVADTLYARLSRHGNGEGGLATVEMMTVLGAPITLPILGVHKLVQSTHTHASHLQAIGEQTLRGGTVFFLGALLADGVEGWRTGDWRALQQKSPKSMLRDYGAMTIGGGAGEVASDAALSVVPTKVLSLGAKSIVKENVALTVALAAADYVRTGEFHGDQTLLTLAESFVASRAVGKVTSVLARSEWLSGASELLGLSSDAGKTTLAGAVLVMAAQITVMTEINRALYRMANDPGIEQARNAALQLLRAAPDDVKAHAALQILVAQLKVQSDVEEQMVNDEFTAAQRDAYKARDVAVASGVSSDDADWTMHKELNRLMRKRDDQLDAIHEARKGKTFPGLNEASEFQNPSDTISAIGLPGDDNTTTNLNTRPKPLNDLLAQTWYGMYRQLGEYVAL